MNSRSAPVGRTRFRWTRIAALICFVGLAAVHVLSPKLKPAQI